MSAAHVAQSITTTAPVLYLALELSTNSRKLAFTTDFGQKARLRTIPARNTEALLDEVKKATAGDLRPGCPGERRVPSAAGAAAARDGRPLPPTVTARILSEFEKWISRRYFPRVEGRDWVFTGTIRDSTVAAHPIRPMKAVGVGVLKWVKIWSAANPHDPEWALYLEARSAWKLTHSLAGRGRIEYLWMDQGDRCVMSGRRLQAEDEPWHIQHRVRRSRGGSETYDDMELLHCLCHRRIHGLRDSDGPGCVPRGAFEEA